jgi:hypothetical protein
MGEGLPKNNRWGEVFGEGFTRVQRLRASYLVRTVAGEGFTRVQRLRASYLVRTVAGEGRGVFLNGTTSKGELFGENSRW